MDMKRSKTRQAQYGCYLILPLKYETDSFSREQIYRLAQPSEPATEDLTESVKAMFTPDDSVSIGSCHPISKEMLMNRLFREETENKAYGECGDRQDDQVRNKADYEISDSRFLVRTNNEEYSFDFYDSSLWIFNTQVAFFSLGITFQSMAALNAIVRPGYVNNDSEFYRVGTNNVKSTFSLEKVLTNFFKGLHLHNFFDKSRLLLEAFAYTVMVFPNRFTELGELRQITFNAHMATSSEIPVDDTPEEEVRFVYASKDVYDDKYAEVGSYRWGCCLSSQNIAYAVANKGKKKLYREMTAQARDGLPIVMLALYEKYTCLRFTELLTHMGKKKTRKLQALKTMMLEFQAYGTVVPANLSRWYNVRNIYRGLLEVNDIPAAINDITDKLNVLSEHQRTIEAKRNETVTGLITIFGIVSILESVLSIVQMFASGDTTAPVTSAATMLTLILIMGIAVLKRK